MKKTYFFLWITTNLIARLKEQISLVNKAIKPIYFPETSKEASIVSSEKFHFVVDAVGRTEAILQDPETTFIWLWKVSGKLYKFSQKKI